MIILLDPLS